MKVSFHVQDPQGRADATLRYLIGKKLEDMPYDEVLISVAYMTVAGVRTLIPNLIEAPPAKSKWLIGLDDYVTQPGAIEVVSRIPGSEVRVVSYREQGLRFHPKVYIFHQNAKPRRALTVLGSSNLTAQALAGNAEANVFLEPKNSDGFKKFENLWNELWCLGHPPTPLEMDAYRKEYEQAKGVRIKSAIVSKKMRGAEILSSDDAELDPRQANLCWIECGYITAMGREIELKAEQGLFFGLDPAGGEPQHFNFLVSSGKTIPLRMKYQANHMWRLQLSNEVPEVAAGLRPRNKDGSLGRSPYVATIERTDFVSTYRLRFIRLESAEFRKLIRMSVDRGTLGKTIARQYGWC